MLASLAAGASVVCTPGFDVNSFSAWLTDFRPTWYSAVPTMHQAILAHARHNRERLADCRLRFVRSSSAPLPPHIFAELERTFETPVIEWYGMTETASSPIACNPLPPRQRKAGSVGVPVGLDVAIMDEGGALLPGGQTGQVVVRGASVMSGYDGDPMATEAAFAGDWFKTGDLGFFDDDGYLFLVGRMREIINRGGEKIAPQEVDEVLLEHPAVAEAVTFAVPHPDAGRGRRGGGRVAAHAAATPKDIRQFAMGRIADFKVPRQVLIVAEIPKGPTGKVQRVGLAAKLGLATSDGPAAGLRRATDAARESAGRASGQRSCKSNRSVFTMISSRWAETLSWPHTFSSACMTSCMLRLRSRGIFEAPTVAEMAAHLETLIQAGRAPRPSFSDCPRAPRKRSSAGFHRARTVMGAAARAARPALFQCPLCAPTDVAVRRGGPGAKHQRDRATPRNSAHDLRRRRWSIRAGHCAAVDRASGIRRSAGAAAVPEGDHRHELIQEELLHSFDLAHGPLIRARLLRLAEQEHLLLICHAPGHLRRLVARRVSSRSSPPSTTRSLPERHRRLAPLPIQYADFAHWQRHWRSYPDIVAQLAYWQEQLRDPLPVMKLASGPSETDNRRFPHGAAGGGVAGEAVGGRQTTSASEKVSHCSWRLSPP